MRGGELFDSLMEMAFGEQDGSEGAVGGGDFGFEADELCELLMCGGEVVAGIGGRSGAEGGIGRAEVAPDLGVGRLCVRCWRDDREACAEEQRRSVQKSHISSYCK